MSEPESGWRNWSHLPAVTAKQRFVLERRHGFIDGNEWSHEDIAGMMGITTRAVKAIEKRALARIRKGLGVPEE